MSFIEVEQTKMGLDLKSPSGRSVRMADLCLSDNAAKCHESRLWGSCAAELTILAKVRKVPILLKSAG